MGIAPNKYTKLTKFFELRGQKMGLRLFFTKILIPVLAWELDNPFNDWLEPISLTNIPESYLIRWLTRELKFGWIRPFEFSNSYKFFGGNNSRHSG